MTPDENAELEAFRAKANVEKQNKEVVHSVFAAIDAGDFDRVDELLADDFGLYPPGINEPIPKDALIPMIKDHYTAFPDWTHVIEDVLADGDRVAVRQIQNGTHGAEFEGIPATGTRVTIPAMHVITVVEGRITDWYAVEDSLSINVQLGLELKPAE